MDVPYGSTRSPKSRSFQASRRGRCVPCHGTFRLCPSGLLFAYGLGALGDVAGSGWLHGLKVVAVAVVAQAVLGMARTLAPDRPRATLAVAATVVTLAIPSA